MSTARRAIAAVSLGLLAATACTSGDDGSGSRDATVSPRTTAPRDDGAATTTTSTTAPRAAAPPPAAPEDAALTALLIEAPPLRGFRRADDRFAAGPLDLEAAARAESDVEAERALLETRHFVRGASRAWTDDDDDVVYVAVYTFGSPADAELYLRDGTETLIARGARGFVVPEVPGATGFTAVEESPSGAFTTHAVAFTSGDRWALAIVGSRGSRRTADDARAVAAAQAVQLGETVSR